MDEQAGEAAGRRPGGGRHLLLLYLAIAIGATAAFGMGVDKNVLVSLASARGLALLPVALVAAVMGAMSIVMVCAFPLNAYGLRVGVHALILGGGSETARQRWLRSLALVGVSTLVASTVDDLGALFQLIGAPTGGGGGAARHEGGEVGRVGSCTLGLRAHDVPSRRAGPHSLAPSLPLAQLAPLPRSVSQAAAVRDAGATTGVYIMFLLPGALLLRLATRPINTLSSSQPRYAPRRRRRRR